jgi:predicted porin
VNVGPVRLAVEAALANGGNSAPGNIIEGNVGFDYMGLSMDFVAGKMKDSVLAQPLSSTQVAALYASGINIGTGAVTSTIADSTVFQAGAKYTIGPWKLFAGYEWVGAVNPSNPLYSGAFIEGG